MKKQPLGLFLFAFTQLWESFSYYGMRALLVLYLIGKQGMSEGDAFAIYALYTCLIEFGSFFGGYLADRYIGLKAAVVIGGGFICLGHLALTYEGSSALFFYGLSFIVCGATLFRGNLKALVGSLYDSADVRRESGFTLFYVGMNCGGFISTLLCAYAAQKYGWSAGFGLASIGMLIGMSVFLACYPQLKLNTQHVQGSVVAFSLSIPLMILGCIVVAYLLQSFHAAPIFIWASGCVLFAYLMRVLWKKMPRSQAMTMLGLLGLLMIYFTCEELMGSLLIVFAENQVDRNFMGREVPSAMLPAINPLVIIGCGPFLSFFLQKHAFSLSLRMGFAFLCLTCAFTLLYLGTATTMIQMIFSFALIALGELFLAPTVYAYCSEVAPDHQKGLTMGVVTLSFALANLLSGQVSQIASGKGEDVVQFLFLIIAILSACIFAGLMLTKTSQKEAVQS